MAGAAAQGGNWHSTAGPVLLGGQLEAQPSGCLQIKGPNCQLGER